MFKPDPDCNLCKGSGRMMVQPDIKRTLTPDGRVLDARGSTQLFVATAAIPEPYETDCDCRLGDEA